MCMLILVLQLVLCLYFNVRFFVLDIMDAFGVLSYVCSDVCCLDLVISQILVVMFCLCLDIGFVGQHTFVFFLFFFSSERRHTICALVTGVQTCALPLAAADGQGCRLRRRSVAPLSRYAKSPIPQAPPRRGWPRRPQPRRSRPPHRADRAQGDARRSWPCRQFPGLRARSPRRRPHGRRRRAPWVRFRSWCCPFSLSETVAGPREGREIGSLRAPLRQNLLRRERWAVRTRGPPPT